MELQKLSYSPDLYTDPIDKDRLLSWDDLIKLSKADILNYIIDYLETTPPESWCTQICATKDLKQFCLLGHILAVGGDHLVNWFEAVIATTFMFYPINDGEHSNYQQPTPKERCIAYIKDLRDGKMKTTQDHERDYDEECLLEQIDNKIVSYLKYWAKDERLNFYKRLISKIEQYV